MVLAGPPPELGVQTFRDPYVFAIENGWAMVVGAGLSDGSGAVLHYHSPDLQEWTFDGVLCARLSQPSDEVWTGTMWECPQLFPLGDSWVLLVSVWDDDVLHYVAAACGDYDGARFVPRTWQRLTYGDSAYATTTFLDADGRRCVLSWLREEFPSELAGDERAGAHSLPAVLTLQDDGLLHLQPHPNLAALSAETLPPQDIQEATMVAGSAPCELLIVANHACQLTIDDVVGPPARLELDPEQRRISLTRPGHARAEMPMAEGAARIVIDADIVEVFNGSSYGAFRLPPAPVSAPASVPGSSARVLAVRSEYPNPLRLSLLDSA